MNCGDVFVFVLYSLVMFWPFAFVFAFVWLVAYYINTAWLAHIRRLLEEQGFRVMQLKRLWFRTAFPGKTRPARSEWLARVVIEDREGRLRSGWVRWHRVRLWDMAERWAVDWDDLPWSGHRDGVDADAPATRA
jgi:hypothetical protein